MTDTHVVSALKTKRIEIASQIEDYREKTRLAVIALDHVEASLRLFDPDVDKGQLAQRKEWVAVERLAARLRSRRPRLAARLGARRVHTLALRTVRRSRMSTGHARPPTADRSSPKTA